MLGLPLPAAKELRILCLGAHADDIEIGCGGAILELLAARRASVTWVVFSGTDERRAEAEQGARRFLSRAARTEVIVESFRDGFFPVELEAVKSRFESLKSQVSPDLVFTHWGGDAHQDHRIVSELTWNTFRNHLILEYEIPKYDGDLGRPGVFIPLSRRTLDRKVATLMSVYGTQVNRHWFTPDTFAGLARLRGLESRSESGFAEAFHVRKIVLAPGAR